MSANFVFRIPLPCGAETVVDMADADLVRPYKWHRGGAGGAYATAWVHGELKYLHRMIMNAGARDRIRHKDGNHLNCRRSNLEIVTKKDTPYRGVQYHALLQVFQARAAKGRRTFRGPHRQTAEEAAHDYDLLARGLFLDRAVLNFPENRIAWIEQTSNPEGQ